MTTVWQDEAFNDELLQNAWFFLCHIHRYSFSSGLSSGHRFFKCLRLQFCPKPLVQHMISSFCRSVFCFHNLLVCRWWDFTWVNICMYGPSPNSAWLQQHKRTLSLQSRKLLPVCTSRSCSLLFCFFCRSPAPNTHNLLLYYLGS